MSELKAKYGLSSDQVGDAKAGVYGAMILIAPVVATLGTEWMRFAALIVFCIAQVVINYLHVGSGINAAKFERRDKTAEELLQEGRE